MQPLYCLPAIGESIRKMDFAKRGRGRALNFTPAGRLAFISKQEGVPGGHSLFSFSLAV